MHLSLGGKGSPMKSHYTFLLILIAFVTNSTAQEINVSSPNIHQFLNNAEKNLDFNGTVLLIRGNDTLVHQGYGYSDRKNKISTNKSIAYNIASVTKGFTAIAIMKLVEEGKLSLSDPLKKYFENLPIDKNTITIHHLLSHTSGIGQNYAAEGEKELEKAAEKILQLPLVDSVGKRFLYSNDNYMLLGIIIEKLTGGTWESYITRTILSPLEMNETFFQNEYGAVTNLRVPMIDGKKPNINNRDYGMMSSTGIFSTAIDLAKLGKALYTHKILTQASKNLLFGKYTKIQSPWAGSNSFYGYAFFVTEIEGVPIEKIWLRGNEDQWGTAIAFWLPKTETTLIVLSNSLTLSNGEKPHIYISNQILKNFIR